MMNRNMNSLHSHSKNRPASRSLESIQESAGCSYAHSEGGVFKENVDVNKSGTPMLNLEPLQMKRKKKGGGCNLRKSLAWDRAFFTEEGVLDPLELSIITGASSGEALSSINNGTPSSSKRTLKPTDCQSSQKIKAGFGSKSGPNSGGCPRPLSSSSLKRPGNLNTAKAAVKESKLQKVPSSITDPTPIQSSNRKIPRPTSICSGQIDQPVFTSRINRALGTSSKTLKTTLTAPKANILQPVRHSEANSRNSCFKEHTSTNPKNILAVKADEDSDSKITTLNSVPYSPVRSSVETGKSISAPTSFTRHAHHSGLNMHSSQNQTMKPSGLRMPSPSLSFFSKPKAPTSHDLSARDADLSISESLKPGSLRLQDNLRTSQKDNNILYNASSISRSTGIISRSGCLLPPHINDASEKVKPNLDGNSSHKVDMKVSSDALHPYLIGCKYIGNHSFDSQIQEHSTKKEIERISPQEEAQKVNSQMLSEDVSYNRDVDRSSDGGCRNPKLISDSSHGTHGSEKESAFDKPVKEPSTSNMCMLNHDASSIGTNFGCVLGQLEIHETTCERKCYVMRTESTDQVICSVVTGKTTRGDENMLETKETAIEIPDGLQQSGTQYSGNKHSSNAEFKDKSELLPDEDVFRVTVTGNLLECEDYLPNGELSSTAEGCQANLIISDVGDYSNLVRTSSECQTVWCEVVSELETDEAISTRNNLSVVATEEQLQAENDLNVHEPKDVFSNDHAAGRLSNNLYQATSRVENDDHSTFSVTTAYEVPCRKYSSNANDVDLKAEDQGEETCGAFTKPSEEDETDMDNQSSTSADTLLVHLPSIMYEQVNHSELSESLTAEYQAENLSLSSDGWNLQDLFLTKSTGSEEFIIDSFEIGESAYMKSSFCTPESPFKHESCIATCAIGASNKEMESDSCIDPLPDSIKTDISQESSDPVNDCQPNSNDLLPERVLSPNNNNHVHGSNTKSRKLILPQNAVPFSDEWLAAIEAAGEDILTKKSGAVQNSPTEKSLPDPSPWSPVKKKNNQIGPFDCTKCTNILPSDSN